MRKRNISVLVRLDKKEHQHLKRIVRKSGLTQEEYIRQLISGVTPREAPPLDYYKMMRELHAIGNNLNQIAYRAHALHFIDVEKYEQAVNEFEKTVSIITQAMVEPLQKGCD